MDRDYGAWTSPSLQRKMEYLWFGNRGRPVLMFPTSMGRFYQNEDFSVVSSLSSKGIPNHAKFWPGVFGHDWPWWKEHLARFLP